MILLSQYPNEGMKALLITFNINVWNMIERNTHRRILQRLMRTAKVNGIFAKLHIEGVYRLIKLFLTL